MKETIKRIIITLDDGRLMELTDIDIKLFSMVLIGVQGKLTVTFDTATVETKDFT